MFRSVVNLNRPDLTVFYCDDSSVARKQIERTLGVMGLKGVSAVNGRQMWEEMDKVAKYAQSIDRPASSIINLVLTDIEMPEMDGYILTKKIKSDPRFNGIPVIMHSSLSGMSNQKLGMSVGVDEYVPKFEPQRLSETLSRLLLVGTMPVKAA
jgi:two-component system chemotaxis response regulator CheV